MRREGETVGESGVGPPRVLGPLDGEVLGPPESSDRFVVDAAETGGRLSIVEHRIAPGVLAAPMHRHEREDEFSYVLEGRVGAVFEGTEVYAVAGDFVRKPRGEWHTFWNAGDGPLRILEIITPGGLEDLFRRIDTTEDPDEVLADADARYGCAIDEDATFELLERLGLRM